MWKMIVKIFSPPVFKNEENKSRSAANVHWISLAFMGGILAYLIVSKLFFRTLTFNILDAILIVVFLLIFTAWRMARNGSVQIASGILVVFLWLAVNGTAYFGYGVRDSAFSANFMVLLATGLLLGWRIAVLFSILTIGSGYFLAYAEVNGITPTAYYPFSPMFIVRDMAVIFVIFAFFIFQLINGLETAVKTAQAGKRELEIANLDLTTVQIRLGENRNELLAANERLAQRAERINTIANISKTITFVQEIERLLASVVTTINNRLGYYHAGIYLLDEARQVALLRAASSDGGRRMMSERVYAVVSPSDVVGSVLDRGEARILLDEGPGAYKFNNPYLPTTRSQLILPLKVREIVIGALDIHSAQPNAFTQEDVSTLQILADQAAIAIQNARSSEAALTSLKKAEVASRQLTGKAWQEYIEKIDSKGYRYDGIKIEPLKEAEESTSDSNNQVTIPMRLHGQVIGRLKLKPPEASRQWTEDEIAIAEATAERVALALESARLLDDAQRKTQRETFLSNVSSKLGSSFQLDSILRDTVEEIGQTFKNSTVTFQLVNPEKTENRLKENEPFSGNEKELDRS